MFTFYQQEFFAHLGKNQANKFFFLFLFFFSPFSQPLAFLSIQATFFELAVVIRDDLCGLINQNC